jgi:16S rRNA (guanine527-N7)-methyltransferase
MSKRCVFLENCRAVLQLENVTVKTLEAERVPQNSFDIVVFRAFRPLEKKMIRVLLRILKPNGKLAAYKAKMEKIQAEMEGIAQWAPKWDVLPLKVPFLTENERNLVVIPKP